MTAIGIRLKELRVKNHLSVAEVAKEIGVSASTYREWEYGRSISGEPYDRLAKVFKVSLSEIILGTRPPLQERLDFIKSLIEDVQAIL
jgi:transcriptional regulator with XRE-family HTH domain